MNKLFDLIGKALYFLRHRPINIYDPFVNIVKTCVPGWLDQGHLYCFDYAIKHLKSDAPILEIGAYCGLSTCVISHYKRKHNKLNKLISVDTWGFEDSKNSMYAKDANYELESIQSFVLDSYKKNVNFFSKEDLPTAVHTTSDDFFDKVKKREQIECVIGEPILKPIEKISFAFIDGNHTYPFVKRDFENVDKLLEIGGFLLFDDSADYLGWGSCKVAKEVSKNPNYKLIIQNPNYFFEKIK